MSENRFRANFDVSIYDSETEEYISVSEKGLEEIAKRMNEQQSTIEQLQDLCGKSDYENAKLRLKNKELQDKIDHLCEKVDKCKMLKEENEQLRKELDNFKPVMFQDAQRGTVILYSKGDIDE